MTDDAVHAPPTSGSYAYYSTGGTFAPDQSGFLGVGESFVDPVFGSTVMRLTSEYPDRGGNDIYASNGWWNADATLFLTLVAMVAVLVGAFVRAARRA